MNAHLLVVAKAPIPGYSKTRLAASVGDLAAAELAADALLDTLAAGRSAFAPGHRVVALAGDLADAVRGGDLHDAMADWVVYPQQGDTFGERLGHAHTLVPGPVVQIGMDTPQVTGADLIRVANGLSRADSVIGPADDGGWWVLGLREPRHAVCLRDVAMSTSETEQNTRNVLAARGLSVGTAGTLRDVDTASDANFVADQHPDLAFSRRWSRVRGAA